MSILLDMLKLGFEESTDRNSILLELHYRGYTQEEAEAMINASGFGRDRKELSNKAKDWRRERFESSRK